MYGLDYAWWRPPSSNWLLQNGYAFVCRYLSWLPNGKVITKAEFDDLRATGVQVVLNWEYDVGDMLTPANGQPMAAEALRQAQALGAWPCPIYFSCDTGTSNYGAVNGFLDNAAAVLGGSNRCGVYGSYYVVKAAMEGGHAAYGWQTFAWSGGLWYGPAQLRQIPGGSNDYDLDQNMADDFGQVGARTVTSSRIADVTQQQMEIMT